MTSITSLARPDAPVRRRFVEFIAVAMRTAVFVAFVCALMPATVAVADPGRVATTLSLPITDWAWVEANGMSWGQCGTYDIFLNNTYLGTKTAGFDNPATPWHCPETTFTAGTNNKIRIVRNVWFSTEIDVFADGRPIETSITLPANATRIEDGWWSGFSNVILDGDYSEVYEDYFVGSYLAPTTITNIVVQ